jgi:hypothetical protein
LESFLYHILFISPYRCNECDERYLRFRLAKLVRRPSAPSVLLDAPHNHE